ncbi:bifunctional diaminohydroxyphosphoribosylaminopyrimidine deaminase/5-amino-6-(5-phosphoribosylamino)uracil reductase RibD [uncultured Winogradskyella sp.]|uniref:bifunctional diaminohydroxyphosphoribosylaminopyrimidine deaminase/5-amino-6-(5-phosphoribosylamino)uracil reductase RibD n=1 Tax=uncultured Winogradskyella sp. TaxID=395353 RepID=UPI0035121CE7
MDRCLQIARNGLGTTRPNPMVGAVIVLNNTIIGEGYTSAYGGPHAEVNAINCIANKEDLKRATLYVSLEPCSHYGKTPPCSDLIIANEIPRIVIGCKDDNPEVAGKGIEKLRDAGRDVTVGVLEEKCKNHHKRFFTFITKKRPYIILKWAECIDGFIAPLSKDKKQPVWLTNQYSRQLVHKWRSEEQAILVGNNTVKEDNPRLTVRDWTGDNPARFVLGRLKTDIKNFNVTDNSAQTILLNEDSIDFSKPVAQQVCNRLFKRNVNSLIVEGGTQTLQSFIDTGLWDEARIFTGNLTLGAGIKAPIIKGKLKSQKNILNDTLRVYEQN